MRAITLDIETTGPARSGTFNPAELDLALIGIHDSETGALSSYTQENLHELWPLIERADLLIGYNSEHFDLPILNKYYSGNLGTIKSVDLLKEIRQALGRRLRLDNVAQATLGRKKSGSGLKAVEWWAEGKYDKVREYCLDDVRLTRELYDYARLHGLVKYTDFDGVREIKLDTSNWEAPSQAGALTHTLPF